MKSYFFANKLSAFLLLTLSAVFFLSPFFPARAATESGSYIIKLKGSDTSVLQQNGLAAEKLFVGNTSKIFQNIFEFTSPLSLAELKNNLQGSFEYLDVNNEVSAGAIELNDPGFTISSTDTNKQWGLVKAGFLDAWKRTAGVSSSIIAIIDTGVDETHEDLRGVNFIQGYDVLNHADISGRVNSDDNGHGTLVSGVIAATPNNQVGIAGAASAASLMPIKALDSSGSGTSANISEAVVWAADHGAKVINMSLGGIGFAHDLTLANAISYAFDKNVVIVAAAGNDVATTGGNLDSSPVFPICDDNGKNMIIGVTATDSQDQKPDFANFGKACVDVAAPGKRILSTINHDPVTKKYVPNAYAFASGTSLSVPFVSAEASLINALFPAATNKEIRDYIIGTTDNINAQNTYQCQASSCAGLIGSGRINAAQSLEGAFNARNIKDGDLITIKETGETYYVNGGKKQLVSNFVHLQRFANVPTKAISAAEVSYITDGSPAEPLDGTLLRAQNDQTVYYMYKGLRLPITYQVFKMRNFNFNDVYVLSGTEVNSWLTGSFLAPPEGSLVKASNSPLVYWVVGGVLHPINHGFYVNRGLNNFPITIIAAADLKSFSKGEAYIYN